MKNKIKDHAGAFILVASMVGFVISLSILAGY